MEIENPEVENEVVATLTPLPFSGVYAFKVMTNRWLTPDLELKEEKEKKKIISRLEMISFVWMDDGQHKNKKQGLSLLFTSSPPD